MTRHTPGPWRVINPMHGIGVQMNSAGGFLIEGLHAEANARLIAAAPELLEACRRTVRLLEPREGEDALVDATLIQNRAAIAKAEEC